MKLMQTGPMTTLSQRIARFTLGLGLAATLAFGAVMPTLAADNNDVVGTAGVTGGSLSFGTITAPTLAATLDGTDQTPNSGISFTIGVNDDTGTGAGWQLSITSTTFTESVGGHTLANTASSITAASVATNPGGTYTPATGNTVSYTSLTLPADTAAPNAVPLFNTAAESGLGRFTVTPVIQTSIPANTYAGSYTSTITLDLVSGPGN